MHKHARRYSMERKNQRGMPIISCNPTLTGRGHRHSDISKLHFFFIDCDFLGCYFSLKLQYSLV